MTDERAFYALRRRWNGAKQAEESYRLQRLLKRYGETRPPHAWMTTGEINQLERYEERRTRISDQFFELLDRVGGRDWRHYVPHWWVMENLTYEDATTTGELTGEIPAAYGTTSAVLQRFMQPVQGEST